MTPIGLYIHIPFCSRKCGYCDFPSFEGRMGQRARYMGHLLQELAQQGAALGRPSVDSVYIGGGTPSLLNPGQMAALLAAVRASFDLTADCEISCEANPTSLTPGWLQALRAGGVNRLSLGAQSADEGLLRVLQRQHTWRHVVRAVSMARAAGFDNLNLDLMLGVPTQTPRMWADTLEAALQLEPEHLSCYGLIVEEGTRMAAMVAAGEWVLPEPEDERAMYQHTLERLAQAGYQQYEISNFAKPGKACRHNINCWRRVDYLGVGSAAHSLMGAERWCNPATLDDYLAGAPREVQAVAPQDAMFESVMLGLRMTQGVDTQAFEARHGRSFDAVFGQRAQPSLAAGLTEWTDGHLRLTRRGMDVMNTVLLDFM